MFSSKLLMVTMIFLGLQLGCKPRPPADTNLPSVSGKKVTGAKAVRSGDEEGTSEQGPELGSDDPLLSPQSNLGPDEKIALLDKQIKEMKTKLAESDELSAGERAKLISSIDELQASKALIQAQLQALTDRQAALEKDKASTTPSSGIPAASSGDYKSCVGNRFCKSGWGWWEVGEQGCSASTPGWKGNGCSCKC